jgi:hypothetical protein
VEDSCDEDRSDPPPHALAEAISRGMFRISKDITYAIHRRLLASQKMRACQLDKECLLFMIKNGHSIPIAF